MKQGKIIIAPDKFKGTLSASAAAEIIRQRLEENLPEACLRIAPMADGGEGTARIIAGLLSLEHRALQGHDPYMNPCAAHFYVDADARAAYLDCSTVLGLSLTPKEMRRPLLASSYPLGELVLQLLQKGIETITIGIGGTATTDSGIGMLQALGAEFFDRDGKKLPHPANALDLERAAAADFSKTDLDFLAKHIRGLSDVEVPLVPSAAEDISTLSFAPQKGVGAEQMPALLQGLSRWQKIIADALPSRGSCRFAGAGGGLGFAIGRIIGAKVSSGAEYLIRQYGMISEETALIITGEGRIDNQTAVGKVVGTIARKAQISGIPVIAIAGTVSKDLDATRLPAKILATDEYLPELPLDEAVARRRLRLCVQGAIPMIKEILRRGRASR